MRPQDSMGALLSGEDSASGPVRSSTKLNSKYVGGKSQINLGFDSGNDGKYCVFYDLTQLKIPISRHPSQR
jgi:hypothetical protein